MPARPWLLEKLVGSRLCSNGKEEPEDRKSNAANKKFLYL
jgi:hypothetical protein